MDGDGFGVGEGCQGPDCNDDSNAINPNAQEVCNGVDDNCDNNIDECPEMGQSCDSARRVCLAGSGASCTRDSDCVSNLVCEGNACLGTAGVACNSDGDCSSDFVCQNNVCGLDPNTDLCGDLDCGAADMFCLEERGECVQCLDTFDCPGVELCAGFVCQGNLDQMDVVFSNDDAAVLEMAQTVASCFHNSTVNSRDDGFRLCAIIDATSLNLSLEKDPVREFVCDDATEEDFGGVDGTLDDAKNAFGCGFTDLDDVEWDEAIAPGEDWVTCIWTIEDFLDDTTVVDDCSNFPTER
jgi:hypothetical protein